MSAIPLRIILHGLIALVPASGPLGSNHMTALMVDGQMSHGEECPTEHTPLLRVTTATSAACSDALCTPNGGSPTAVECVCDARALTRKELSLKITPSPILSTPVQLKKTPSRSLPGSVTEAADFSYIVNLSQPPFGLTLKPPQPLFGLTLNPQYLASQPPTNLLARMEIDFASVTACNLSSRDDGGRTNVHAMSLRTLHATWTLGEASQAMAQMVVTQLDVPDANGAPQKVQLTLRDFGGSNSHVLELAPEPGASGYKIDLSNEVEQLASDDPCDDGIGRHFAYFYELASEKTEWDDRLVPHLRLTQLVNANDITPPACVEPTHNLNNHPICAMAVFNP